MGPNASEIPAKLPTKPGPGVRKGLMKGPAPVIEERHVLLREDSSYALKYISSIIKDDNYSELGNHATEAMGETGLFSLTQLCIHTRHFYLFCHIVAFVSCRSNFSISCRGWS